MASEHKLHSRRSIRLRGYDYSWPGWYYVTLCTKNRACVLGEIVWDKVCLSTPGQIVERCWKSLPEHFASLDLDAYVTMPNHFHGILILGGGLINQTPTVREKENTSREEKGESGEKESQSWILMKNPDLTLGKIVRFFKAKSAKLVHDRGFHNFEWQRNYYEHIIRNDFDLHRIRTYIRNNPVQWTLNEKNSNSTISGQKTNGAYTSSRRINPDDS